MTRRNKLEFTGLGLVLGFAVVGLINVLVTLGEALV